MSFWIRTAEKPATTHFYEFTESITVDEDPSKLISAKLSICADSRYRLYVNGFFIGEGPCQG